MAIGDYPASWGFPFDAHTASDIQVTYNTIINNEWGISVFNDITDALIQCNEILGSTYDGIDVYNYGYGDNSPTNIIINYNDIVGNGPDGLWVGTLVTQTVDAECNWWGDHSGPSGDGPGTGDTVVGNADYDPWIYVDANAGGPYFSGGPIHFDASATSAGACGTLSYHWDFGDGTTGAGVNPMKTYPYSGVYTVTLTVTLTTVCGKTYSDTDTTTAEFVGDCDPPIIQLIYPTGGEILSGTVTVEWFAIDEDFPGEINDLPIYMYFSSSSGNIWIQIDDVLKNDGEYSLDTTDFADGEYRLKVEARHCGIVADTSDPFTIDNDQAGMKISQVRITDKTINSYNYVKDGDEVEVTAGITGGLDLTIDDITADLSALGGGTNVHPVSYNGYVATWEITEAICGPSDGLIQVTINIDGHSNIGTITADNTKPTVTILKPTNGLYLFNMRIFPFLSRTVIIGAITIQADPVDTNGIEKAEFYLDILDNSPEETTKEQPYQWHLGRKLRGLHNVKILVYDLAGNIHTSSIDMTIFGF
jgi:hypothetical protein